MNSDLFISKEASIKDALNQLSASGMKCLLVIKEDNKQIKKRKEFFYYQQHMELR